METMLFSVINQMVKPMKKVPFLYEHALQEYILLRPELLTLSDDMKDIEILWAEKATVGSRYDLVISYKDADMQMIAEIKKGEIDMKAYGQICKYLSNEEYADRNSDKFQYGLLIGTSISTDVIKEIESSSNLYAIVISRFDDNNVENISTVIYKPLHVNRDYTKYTLTDLQGNVKSNLGKGKLAYEIIRSYVQSQINPTCQQIQREFQEVLQRGSLKIVIDNKSQLSDKLQVRYFKTPIVHNNLEILVCNQWGITNIQNIIKIAKKMGMIIN
jgi:hypothetical protein